MLCTFCKKNGEQESYYTSHNLKDENHKVTCPVLLEFVCPSCNQKGKHTVSYCPLKKGDTNNKLDVSNSSSCSGGERLKPIARPIKQRRPMSIKPPETVTVAPVAAEKEVEELKKEIYNPSTLLMYYANDIIMLKLNYLSGIAERLIKQFVAETYAA